MVASSPWSTFICFSEQPISALFISLFTYKVSRLVGGLVGICWKMKKNRSHFAPVTDRKEIFIVQIWLLAAVQGQQIHVKGLPSCIIKMIWYKMSTFLACLAVLRLHTAFKREFGGARPVPVAASCLKRSTSHAFDRASPTT